MAPLEPITLPRLELLSGLLLVNLVTKISAALSKIIQFDKLTCWLDSRAALWWIYGENKQFKRFVQSRVEKIRKLVNKERFRYVPSELNPSNIGSLGAKLSEIRNNLIYWNGPDFLLQSEEHWPDILPCPSDAAVAVEVKSELKLPPVESLTVLTLSYLGF